MPVTQLRYAEKINESLKSLGIHLSQHPFGYTAVAGVEICSFDQQEQAVSIRMGHELDTELIDAKKALLVLKDKMIGDVCVGSDSTAKGSLWDVLQDCGL